MPKPVSDRRIAMTRLAIIVTVSAWISYFITWLLDDFLNQRYSSTTSRAEAITYIVIMTLLTASALAYLLSRLGFCYRTRSHHRSSRASLDHFYDDRAPTLTAIVPSYQEEEHVIRNTLLSAALQEYPHKRVVLLIDDPPVPKSRRARDQLSAARALPAKINELLAAPKARFVAAAAEFETRYAGVPWPDLAAMTSLSALYEEAVNWLRQLAASLEVTDHSDAFFCNEVAHRLGGDLQSVAWALRDAAAEDVVLDHAHLRRLYRRLIWIFRCEVASFERKQYSSLSHEPNKAMNLNSYIGLMGGSYREVRTVTGTVLASADPADCDFHVPDPDYVLTLDADSVLLPEYCLRLVHLLEQSEHRNTAIAQTPYSAFPGSATRLERIAGASTDLQHIVHQGLTYYDATFWVGANAVIRKRALDAIVEKTYIGDWEIRQYIRDRTVIEDTESTIDMGIHGWRLHNYPERLSYSATPPDFGSLCIQRRRWANGGLLILPKLHLQRRARRQRGERTRFAELFMRCNYMASICWSSFSLLILLVFPFNAALISPLLGVVALPYFLAQASDLRYCGYKRIDVARIYGFNLILLPVNLAGTVSSLVQGITASKSAFARTPKVRDRTVAPPFFVIAPYLVIALAIVTFYTAYQHDRVENMAYAALNIVLASYATLAFIGVRNSLIDAWVHFTSLLYKPAQPRRRAAKRAAAKVAAANPAPADWRSVLQVGPIEAGHWRVARQHAPQVSAELPNRSGRHRAGLDEPVSGQQGPGQHGPGQHGPGQHGPGQHGPGQHGPGRTRPAEIEQRPAFQPGIDFALDAMPYADAAYEPVQRVSNDDAMRNRRAYYGGGDPGRAAGPSNLPPRNQPAQQPPTLNQPPQNQPLQNQPPQNQPLQNLAPQHERLQQPVRNEPVRNEPLRSQPAAGYPGQHYSQQPYPEHDHSGSHQPAPPHPGSHQPAPPQAARQPVVPQQPLPGYGPQGYEHRDVGRQEPGTQEYPLPDHAPRDHDVNGYSGDWDGQEG